MPSRRRAFWIVPAVLGALGLLPGCSRPQAAWLPSVADLERSGHAAELAGAGFAIPCASDRPWVARLERVDFSARLELQGALGRTLSAASAISPTGGHDYVYRPSRSGGAVSLEVVPVGSTPGAATYRLQVFCLRADPPADADRALRAMNAAAARGTPATAAQRDAAAAQYGEAEATWARLGEPRLAADVGLALAALHYFEREDWPQALAAARRVAASPAAATDARLRAGARLLEGAAALELANAGQAPAGAGAAAAAGGKGNAIGGPADAAPPDPWAAATAALQEARTRYSAGGAPVAAAQAQNFLAGIAYSRGEFGAAAAGYEAAAAALHAAGAAEEEARAAGNLAAVRYDGGDFAGAALAFGQLLERLPRTPTDVRAIALQNRATALAVTGDSEGALVAYREALDIATAIGNDDLLARSLAGLGVNHARLGHRDLALTYLLDALALRRGLGVPLGVAQALALLGDLQLQRGELARARAAHREALETVGPTATPLLRARLQLALGLDQAAGGEHRDAIDTYSRVLALLPASHSLRARTLVARARSARLSGAPQAAGADLRQAIALARAGDDRESLIGALVEDARLAAGRDDLAAAIATAGSAVAEVERLPAGAANPDNRLTLRARLRAAYELQVDLLAGESLRARARGEAAVARARAEQALRAAVGVTAAMPLPAAARSARAGVDPLADTYAQLAARRYRLETLAERNSAPTPTMRALEREVALLRTRLATGARGAAGVAPAAPLVAPAHAGRGSAARERPMPADAAIVTYWLGESRSWAWTTTRAGVELHALPPRAAIDAAVARLLQRVRAVGGDGSPDAAAEALERLVVPAPMSAAAVRRWRIVPDGSLGAVPWPLLAARRGLESASLLSSPATWTGAAIESAPAAPAASGGPRRLALFGDPVFDARDPRVVSQGAKAPRLPESDPRELARLPGTARELDVIARLGGTDVVVQASGFGATRAALLQLPPGGIDVLHLATHAIIDADLPELAALVLSRVDASGAFQPGNLRAHDILGMAGAPALVVLSACDAAAEPSGAADGRMNLVRAFLASGTRDVVASLWEASDAGTTELMTRFYEGLLGQGLEPEVALARAQARLAASGRFRAPFYWAGFVVTRAAP